MESGYLQLGYVARDFDEAIETLRRAHGLGPFKEMRDLTIGARGDCTATCHFGLAFVRGAQFEVITPLAGDVEFYDDCLLAGGMGIVLHHIGRYFADQADYALAKGRFSARWDKSVECSLFGGEYCYFDSRPDLGTYSEIYCFPPESHFDGVPRY